jgi:NAD(P)-dependent dehydrogenase (short-subunit alcohol dehydrogenase family)
MERGGVGPMSRFLEGKAIVVTGAGRGLGRAFALDAAAQGARVVVNDCDAPEATAVADEILKGGGVASPHVGSVSDWGAAGSLVDQCVTEFGALDGLVNNAAVFHYRSPWEERPEDIRTIVEVNLIGAMFCGLHALGVMREQNHGSIVNIVSGSHIGNTNQAAYGATKGGLTSLTYAWAIDTHPFGIRVNAVSPIAETRLSPMVPSTQSPRVPHANPMYVAPLVTFLLSDRARFSGQVVRLDGHALSVLTQPRFPQDPLTRETWDVDQISSAFDGALGETISNVGLRPVDLSNLASPAPQG